MIVKFNLVKLEKALAFQLLHIDPNFKNFGIVNRECNVVIAWTNMWSSSEGKFLSSFSVSDDRFSISGKTYYINLSNFTDKPRIIDFSDNVNRDIVYNLFIKGFEQLSNENNWIDIR